MTVSSQHGGNSTLTEMFTDLFILATYLKHGRDYGNPDLLRQKILEMFNDVDRKGSQSGTPPETLRQSRYAMAALLDELILSSPWPCKEQWSSNPLQYEFFKETMAGVEFFNRLEVLRRAPIQNREILEVYYLCLILGFEGQYKLSGQEKLKVIIEQLSRELEVSQGQELPLSRNGKRPDEFIEMLKQGLPSWVVIASSAMIIFLFFLTLSSLISHDANDAAQNIRQLVERGP